MTYGGAGNDLIVMQWSYYGGPVNGDAGDDRISSADSGNTLAGGAGADTLSGGAVADLLVSGSFVANSAGYYVAPADDAGLEHDRLSGGSGDDALAIGYGDDADGGTGTDTLRLSLAGLTQGIDFNTAGIVSGAPFTLGGGVIQNVESLLSLRGTDFADTLRLATQNVMLTIDAGAGDDVIISQSSSVSVLGGAGNDRFVSGPAGDTFDGGTGDDTIDYSAAASPVTVDLNLGSGAGGDSLAAVEAVIGSAFSDTLGGSSANNTLVGGAGADSITSGAGADSLDGGAGNDTLDGGDGNDSIFGGLGDDVLIQVGGSGGPAIYDGGGGTDTLRAVGVTTAGTDVNGLPIDSVGVIGLTVTSIERLEMASTAGRGLAFTIDISQIGAGKIDPSAVLVGGLGKDVLVVVTPLTATTGGTFSLPNFTLSN